ncbi:Uncharacterised protein [Mycobacteroides abscessus subsp. massiliense]|nr:Uncharacterised protein [Mycobacteroides abscessus subsp. massiliense]
MAQLRFQPAKLASFRVGGRQGAGPADVAIELVEQQLLRGHADESGIQGLGQPPLHLRLFGGRRALIVSGRAIQSHRGGPHIRMPKEGSNIRPQRQRFQCGDVLTGIRPGLVPVDGLNHVVARYRLHPAEDVPGIDAVDVYDRQGARTKQDGGHAMTHRLRQRRCGEHFDVVVGVDVHQPRQHPLSAGVDDVRAVCLVEVVGRDRSHMAVLDTDVTYGGRRARSVKPSPISDDGVELGITARNHADSPCGTAISRARCEAPVGHSGGSDGEAKLGHRDRCDFPERCPG